MRLETLQRLVELKSQHPRSLNLLDLKPVLDRAEIKQETDEIDLKINGYIDQIWQRIREERFEF